MKIGFIFTEEADLTQVPNGGRFRSNFEIPDEAKSLPDLKERIIAAAELVGYFTWANLHVTCLEADLKDYPIKQTGLRIDENSPLFAETHALSLYFKRNTYHKKQCKLAIYAPTKFPYPQLISISKQLAIEIDAEKKAYLQRIMALSEQFATLLNTDGSVQKWRFDSLDPSEGQQSLATRFTKLQRKQRSNELKQARDEEKRKAREAKQAAKLAANPPQELTHGAGRVVGARTGIYKGIQMRSQLEIRFAAELDERGIQWIYEGEALGAASYLVDFYLPDLGAWVEVKGRFEARDRQVLPEVAKYLKTERQHRLLVYTGSGKCCVVNPSGFREIERKNFWGELMR